MVLHTVRVQEAKPSASRIGEIIAIAPADSDQPRCPGMDRIGVITNEIQEDTLMGVISRVTNRGQLAYVSVYDSHRLKIAISTVKDDIPSEADPSQISLVDPDHVWLVELLT